jgi:hypothetical protein
MLLPLYCSCEPAVNFWEQILRDSQRLVLFNVSCLDKNIKLRYRKNVELYRFSAEDSEREILAALSIDIEGMYQLALKIMGLDKSLAKTLNCVFLLLIMPGLEM